MGKKDKKKGKGAEKTALKTEKKALNRLKKDLAAKGEVDIKKLISEIQEQGRKRTVVTEEPTTQPSPRSGFTLCAHPDKEELILFGGEYFNGSKTEMYNDLYFYNIKKSQWSILQSPNKPPPRCSHQVVVTSQNGGQMWLFGGEFASSTRSNFYHYNDLWVYHFAEKRWEQMKAAGGPSARSGHRMVVSRKQLILFGGFYEAVGDYKYFNDVHMFNLESYSWNKIEVSGKIPSPRSGCQMAALTDGRILVYGGYSRERIKKDVDKGHHYSDMYYLQFDERHTPPKWKWVQAKAGGLPPTPRSGLSMETGSNNQAYAFGGVHDEERDEEDLKGNFHNDLYIVDLESGRWQVVTLRAKDAKGSKKRRRRGKEGDQAPEEEIMDTLESTTLSDEDEKPVHQTSEDSIFTVTVGPSSNPVQSSTPSRSRAFAPPARMKAGLAFKTGILYLYGGLFEDGDRQYTLCDFYSLDVRKLEEWKTIVPFVAEGQEWVESESGSDDDDEDEDESSSEEDMETA